VDISRPTCAGPASDRAFAGVSALLFAASAAVTIVWCASMSAMGGMPMPGGWTMSMAWMRMPGQTWSAAAASFVGMWTVMMAAMMLPSLVPMLRRYREAVCSAGAMRLGRLTALVGAGYFFVWTAFGAAVFPLGVALAVVEMQQPELARAVPLVVGVVVVIAGLLQLTPWKARHLACCRQSPGPGRRLRGDDSSAWRHGLRLGVHCGHCCAGPMAVLLPSASWTFARWCSRRRPSPPNASRGRRARRARHRFRGRRRGPGADRASRRARMTYRSKTSIGDFDREQHGRN
jgi:predicted metal-binding membrane protein